MLMRSHFAARDKKYKRGKIIYDLQIHTDFTEFHLLPGLARQLRRPINVFSICLRKPLEICSSVPVYYEPWFTSGGAILITEDVILNHTNHAFAILEWYHNYIRGRYPVKWKLVFRPDIRTWLLNLAVSWQDEKYVRTMFIPFFSQEHKPVLLVLTEQNR